MVDFLYKFANDFVTSSVTLPPSSTLGALRRAIIREEYISRDAEILIYSVENQLLTDDNMPADPTTVYIVQRKLPLLL
jgi:hypothetical protein